MRTSWITIAALPLAACANAGGEGNGSAYADGIARQEAEVCIRAPAPTAAHQAHLRRLCGCLETRLRNSDIQPGDGQAALTARVQQFAAECIAEVGDGSGLPPPGNGQ